MMYRFELHQIQNVLDTYIRQANKYWARNTDLASKNNDEQLRKQTLIDCFHMLRVATVLTHPIMPTGSEKTVEYLQMDKDKFFNWDNIFEDIYYFAEDKENHQLKQLAQKEDFYVKHPSQFM